jgi:hypothetical protein
MYVTLVAIRCHALNGVPLCQERVIAETRYDAEVGKIFDPETHERFAPIPEPGLGMSDCKYHAQAEIAKWIGANEPASWAREWKCVPGHYEIARRA